MTHEEMEQTLGRLAELQLANQQSLRETLGAMGKLSGLVADFVEDTHERVNGVVAVVEHLAGVVEHLAGVTEHLAGMTERLAVGMDRLEARITQLAEEQNHSLIRLEGLIEAFIRGSRDGGKEE